MEIIISIVFLNIVGFLLILLFSDEFLDKQEQKIIKKELKERLKGE